MKFKTFLKECCRLGERAKQLLQELDKDFEKGLLVSPGFILDVAYEAASVGEKLGGLGDFRAELSSEGVIFFHWPSEGKATLLRWDGGRKVLSLREAEGLLKEK